MIVKGSGFPPNQTVELFIRQTAWTKASTNVSGAFMVSANIPMLGPDVYTIRAWVGNVLWATHPLNIHRLITWAASRDSNWEIYTMREDGSKPTRLTWIPPQYDLPGGPADQHPVFTPDGSQIVWTRSPDFLGEVGNNIWKMNVDGSGKTQLTFSGHDNHPYVATVPGIGTKIYFNREAANGAHLIMRMNLDGSNVEQITGPDLNRYHPQVRYTDGLILYAVDMPPFDKIGDRINTFNQATGVETTIYNPGWKASGPSWRADGAKIVFAEDPDGDINYRISTMNPDGSGVVAITSGALHDTTPYYTGVIMPPTNKIVFNRDNPTPDLRDVYIMNEDGTGVTNLTAGQPGGADSSDTFVVEQGSCGPKPPVHKKRHVISMPPPLPITELTAVSSSESTVTLTWSPSEAADFSYYAIYVSRTPMADVTGLRPVAIIADIKTTTYKVSGRMEGTTDWFAVTAIDLAGNEDGKVSSVSATPTRAPTPTPTPTPTPPPTTAPPAPTPVPPAR